MIAPSPPLLLERSSLDPAPRKVMSSFQYLHVNSELRRIRWYTLSITQYEDPGGTHRRTKVWMSRERGETSPQ